MLLLGSLLLLLKLLLLLRSSTECVKWALTSHRGLVVLRLLPTHGLAAKSLILIISLVLIVSCLELVLLLRHSAEWILLLLPVACHGCSILLLLRHSTLVVVSVSHLTLDSVCHLIIDLLLWSVHLAHEHRIWNKFRLFRLSLLFYRCWLRIVIRKRIEWRALVITSSWGTTAAKVKSIVVILVCILRILCRCST